MSKHFSLHLPLLLAFSFILPSAQAQTVGAWNNTGPVNFPINSSGQVNGLGRVSQMKFHPTNSQKIYAVSASGGAYITANNGSTWTALSGTETLPQTSCSAICINYDNDKTLYLCLGDANYFSNDYGIYKSLNGGVTWAAANTGISTNMAVEILMDPMDTSTLVAATKGGLYRTTNGGGSWTQVQSGIFRDMKANTRTGSRTLYAATATAFYVSSNFGATWTQITSGISFPATNGGTRIAVSASDTNRIYLGTTGGNGVIMKSTNGGASFSTVYSSSTQCLVCYDAGVSSGSQGDYNFDITANPTNADELLVVAHNVWRSTNAGANWNKRTTWYNECHTDMHHIEWNPYNNAQIWNGNDGGLWLSTDTTAKVWTPRCDGLAACEVYHASQSATIRDLISIGTQDNGELYYNATGWRTNRGGDWTYRSAIDYRSGGNVWYLETGKRRTLAPLGSDLSYNSPYPAVTGTFTANNVKIEFIPTVTSAAFLGKDSLYRSTNITSSTPGWTRILNNTNTIRDLETCHADSNILYVMSGSNTLLRTDNALATTPTWTTLTPPASFSSSGSIATWKYNANVVFVSCFASIYRSTDKGATWTNISGTGLSTLNIRKIICDDHSAKQRVFVNAGAYVHFKDSTTTVWSNHTVNAGLPTVANATDFMIYNDGTANSILRLATFGRGVWQCNIADNLPPMVDFNADKTIVCTGDSVHFIQNITGGFSSLKWTFTGGTPATSTANNPAVRYNTNGIFAVKLVATNAYGSDSVMKTAYINVGLGQGTQVVEGFEGTSFPPANWTLQNNSGTDWAIATVGGFGASSKSISYNNFKSNANGSHDNIITPKVNLSSVANARLKFDLAYAPYSASYPDSLQVRVSTDCGSTWSVIYNKSGTVLATRSAYTSTFIPTATEWRTDSVSLLPYVGGSVLLSFENIGHYGQGLYLDNINILFVPKAKFGVSDTAICSGATINFIDSSGGATAWNWSFPGGTPSSSTLQNPTVNYSTPGSFTVKLIASNASGTDSLLKNGLIHVYAAPAMSLGNDTTICPGMPLVLDAGNAGSSFLYNNAAITQLLNVTSAGTYSVKVTTPQGCIGRDTIVVTAGTNPVVNLGNDTSICPGTSILLNAGNTGNTFRYNTNASTQTINVTTGGSYSVAVTNAQHCVGRDTINIAQGATPVVHLGNDTTLCSGATLTLNAGNAGSTFLYSNSATTQTTTVSTAATYTVKVTNAAKCVGSDTIVINTGTNPVVHLGNDTILCPNAYTVLDAGNPGATYRYSTNATTQTIVVSMGGSYSVAVTNAQNCVGRDTINISSGNNPIVNLGNDTTLCSGASLTLNAGNAGSTFLYSSSATTQATTVSAAATYTVRVTDANHCVGHDTIIITTGTNPTVNLGHDTTLCPGITLTLNAGNTGSSFLYSTSAATQSINVSIAGTYHVRVTNAAGCVGRDTIVLTAASNPSVLLGKDTTICPGTSITLDAGNLGSTYLYSNTATTRTTTVSSAGSYSVAVTNTQGCIGRDTVNIAVGTNPVVNMGNDTSICQRDTIRLNAGNAGSKYLYSNGDTTITSTITTSGTFYVRVTNAQGCVGRDTIIITVSPLPVVNLGNDTVLCPGSSLMLNAGNAGSSYLYNAGASTQTLLVSAAGTYSVRVTNAQLCVGRDTILVTAGTIPIPIISGSSNTLNAGTVGLKYQWFLNGVAIPGATAADYVASESGVYKITVTNGDGCEGTSAEYSYTHLGVGNALLEAGYELFPNPGDGQFTLTGKGIAASEIVLTCYDAMGKKVAQETIAVQGGKLRRVVDWTRLARGVYAINISDGNGAALKSTITIR